MKHQSQKRSPMLGLVLITAVLGFCSLALSSIGVETRNAIVQMGASDATEITFTVNSPSLSEDAKAQLGDFIANADKNGIIEKVKVAAWADRENPASDPPLSGGEMKLADLRAKRVQTYLQTSLSVSQVSILNMAERPSKENSMTVPAKSDQTGLFGLKGKASKALVMVYYK